MTSGTSTIPSTVAGRTVAWPKGQAILAWVLLLGVWLVTPFIGDRTPAWASTLYWVQLVGAVGFGLYVTWRRRSILLGIASVLTVFSWFILLMIGLALFGIN